jgi:hypothetical protein
MVMQKVARVKTFFIACLVCCYGGKGNRAEMPYILLLTIINLISRSFNEGRVNQVIFIQNAYSKRLFLNPILNIFRINMPLADR